ncbi:MAG: preprotein translocase subunit YajC [Spirochaetales bacterium]|nr:preprotein translocase subunit YajC [Spirochaetales bacterium]MBR2317784.1 preprotein translocase subunit YajC [Spirochaetales bacterium]
MLNGFFLAQAANPQAAAGSQMGFMVFLVIMLVVYWVFLIRPQSKKRKELAQKLSNLKKGDRVVTIGGIHGKVVSVKDKVVVVRIDDRAEITFDKNAISTVEGHGKDEPAAADNKEKEEEVEKNNEEK